MVLAVFISANSLVWSKLNKSIWVSSASLYCFIKDSSYSMSLLAMASRNIFVMMVILWSGGAVGMADFNFAGKEPKAWLRS